MCNSAPGVTLFDGLIVLVVLVLMVLCVLQSLLVVMVLVVLVLMVLCVLQTVPPGCNGSSSSNGSNGSVCVAVPADSSSSRQNAEHLHLEGTFPRIPLRLFFLRVYQLFSLFLNLIYKERLYIMTSHCKRA